MTLGEKPFIRGMTTLKKSDEANILLITAAIIFVLVLILAAITEYGRYFLIREKTQTAADSAALAAAAAGTTRWIEFDVTFDYGYWWKSVPYYCDCTSYGCDICYDHYLFRPGVDLLTKFHDREKDAPGKVAGYVYKPLKDRRDFVLRNQCLYYGSRKSPVYPNACYAYGMNVRGPIIQDRWVEYNPGEKETAANTFFKANLPNSAKDGYIETLDIHLVPPKWDYDNNTEVYYPDPKPLRNDRFYPSVIVKAKVTIEKLWDNFRAYLGPQETSVCAQASTHYAHPTSGNWSKPPDEACVPD